MSRTYDRTLFPCPFCGSEDIWSGIYSGSYCISCSSCEASMGGEEYDGDMEKIKEQWNTRDGKVRGEV